MEQDIAEPTQEEKQEFESEAQEQQPPANMTKNQRKKWKKQQRKLKQKQEGTQQQDQPDGKKKGKKVTKLAEMAKKRREAAEKQKKQQAEQDRLDEIAFQNSQKKEEELIELKKQEREKKAQEKAAKIKQEIKDGTYLTPAQKERIRKTKLRNQNMTVDASLLKAPEGGKGHVVKRKKKKKRNKKIVEEVKEEIKVEDEAERKKSLNLEEEIGDWMQLIQEDEKDKKQQQKQPEKPKQEKDKKPEKKVNTTKDEKPKKQEKSEKKEEIKKTDDQKAKENKPAKTKKLSKAEKIRIKKQKKYDKMKQDIEDSKKVEGVVLSEPTLRAPICCILGHVDVGKTQILDSIRKTSVQANEAGGITQQIGATLLPRKRIYEEIKKVANFYPLDIKIKDLLVIDTPGHETFSNLRSRGSGLCDIAVLVIDIHRGVQKQTLESIELLKMRKTPFIIALNKIDRIFEWKTEEWGSSFNSISRQKTHTKNEFDSRMESIITQLNMQRFNAAPFYDNPNPIQNISLVPTSAWTGEGIPDLLACITNIAQIYLAKKIKQGEKFKASVLECNKIEGLGATIDIILVSGELKIGDKICVLGFEGPIITTIKGLYIPQELKELKQSDQYIMLQQVEGAIGVKITADNLQQAVAGSDLFLIQSEQDEQFARDFSDKQLSTIRKSIKHQKFGVCVHASTLGALEALLKYLKKNKVPVAHIGIGPVSKEQVLIAMRPLLQKLTGEKMKKEYATILAFDIKILPDAKQFAKDNGIKIILKDVIYHLTDDFKKHVQAVKQERKRLEGKGANFPCRISSIKFFNKKSPIVIGCNVTAGQVRLGSILCIPSKENLVIGEVLSIEREHKQLTKAILSTGDVALKIKSDPKILAGRHFMIEDSIVSLQNRDSLDLLLEYFRDEMKKEDWDLMRELKQEFGFK